MLNQLTQKIETGKYLLNKDIVNPDSDRRCKRDWRYEPILKAGTLFYIQGDKISPEGIRSYEIRDYHALSYKCLLFYEKTTDPLILEILSNITRIEEKTVGDIFNGRDSLGTDSAATILAHLVEQGKLTVADIETANSEVYNMPEDGWHDLKKKHNLR